MTNPTETRVVPVEPTDEMLDAFWHSAGESKEMRSRTHVRARRYYAAMLAAAPAAPEPAPVAYGWLYYSPDAGLEWSEQHPVDSGETPDAERVEPATLEAMHRELMAAWGDLVKERAASTPPAPVAASTVSPTPVADNPEGQTSVKVKALEWKEVNGGVESVHPPLFYDIMVDPDADMEESPWVMGSEVETLGHYPTLAAAKLAAQADYERRVRACLEPGQGWRDIASYVGHMPALVSKPSDKVMYGPAAAFLDATSVWRALYSDGGMTPLGFTPTHWMPLPSPPAAEEE